VRREIESSQEREKRNIKRKKGGITIGRRGNRIRQSSPRRREKRRKTSKGAWRLTARSPLPKGKRKKTGNEKSVSASRRKLPAQHRARTTKAGGE